MAAGMPIDYFVESVFNYPTLAECYKVAALKQHDRIPRQQRYETRSPRRSPANQSSLGSSYLFQGSSRLGGCNWRGHQGWLPQIVLSDDSGSPNQPRLNKHTKAKLTMTKSQSVRP